MEDNFYRGNLPHWQPPEATFFVTYRLFGSIPKSKIEALKAEYAYELERLERYKKLDLSQQNSKFFSLGLSEELQTDLENIWRKRKQLLQYQYFTSFDELLESNLNEPHWLKTPEIANTCRQAIHYFDGQYYTLWAYTVMSNHIHIVLSLLPNAPILWAILQRIKRFSATKANAILDRTGLPFWEKESYDHLVRDGSFGRIMAYTLENPVKAGYVKRWEEYPYNYCHSSLMDEFRMDR